MADLDRPEDRAIHPDCADARDEFHGWLKRLTREAREAGADPAGLAHLLRYHARRMDGHEAAGDVLAPDALTEAVVAHLREQGHDDAAEWTAANHRDGRALGPAEVAAEEGLAPTTVNVPEIAGACLGGFRDYRSGLDGGDA